VSLLTDLAAASVAFDDLADLYSALGALHQELGDDIVYFEDRMVVPQKSGYRDILMMLRTSTGHIAEFRLQLKALDRVAEWEHALYEVGRDLKAVAEQEGRSMSAMERALRGGLLRQTRHYFWEALQTSMTGDRARD
jgi:(p)ppGpp synthase/HD superfamily hydrolase